VNKKREFIIKRLKDLENKIGRRPVKRDDSYLYSLSREYFGSWNNMMSFVGYNCRNFQKPFIPNKHSPDLYYFLGLVSTDGHIQAIEEKSHYRVLLYTSEKEEVNVILKIIQRLFGYRASVRARKTEFSLRPNYEIYISSKIIAEFLNKLGIPFGAKSSTIRLPKAIIHCNDGKFWNYIRGVFDGDGSIIFSGGNTIFKISSGSIGFLNDLNKIFFKKGFKTFKVSFQDKNVWELRTNTRADIRKLYSLVYNGPYFYPRKKSKWEIILREQHV
jgi:hypothetical protein